MTNPKQPWQYTHYPRQMLAYRVKNRTSAAIAADLLTQASEERRKGNYALAFSCVVAASERRRRTPN